MAKTFPSPIDVRPADPDHWPAIRDLLELEGLPTDDLSAQAMTSFLIARNDRQLLGAIGMERYGNVALLRSLVVAPTGRRQGVGRQLTRAAEAAAAHSGIHCVFLLTQTAVSFFDALGYRPAERSQAPAGIQGSRQFSSLCPTSAVLMVKALPAKPYHVLILCTGNSARSVLGEVLINRWGQGQFVGHSAGSFPKGQVHPMTLRLLHKLELPTDGLRSKSWDEFSTPGAPQLDFVFTVCDNAAGEVCPIWPGQPITAHWGVDDPAAVGGPEAVQLAAFHKAYRELEARIKIFCSLPIASLDRMRLQARLDEIGRLEDPPVEQP